MAKPFKPVRACPIPPDAELVDVAGRPHVRLKERGKPILYPVSKDGLKYLRPMKRWYFKCRDANGTVRRVKGFADLKATEQLAAEHERKAERLRSGYSDPADARTVRRALDALTAMGMVTTVRRGKLNAGPSAYRVRPTGAA